MSTRQTHVEQVMGTAVSFDVRDDCDARPAIEQACDWLHHVDRVYSTYRHDSVISQLALGELRPEDADPEVRALLRRCADLHHATGGAFDLYATGTLDPSGYVKGWATQVAAVVLERHGHQDWMINAGGDIVAHGHADVDDAEGWRVGIRHPHDHSALAAVAILHDRALATSARYERGDHVPARDSEPALDSVTVIAEDLGTADAWATAILAGGRPTLELAARRASLETFVITQGRTLRTDAFPLCRTPHGSAAI